MSKIWRVSVVLLVVMLGGPAAGLEVTGRVRAGSRPVVGARVEVVPIPDGEERGRLLAAGAVTLPAVATGESDGEGRYRLEAPGPGLWGLLVRAEEFVPMVYHLMPLVEATEVPEVSLLADAGAPVRVLDPLGRAVTGARVRGRGNRDPVWRPAAETGWLPVRTFVSTRADGRARLPRAAGERLPFSAWAPDWVETAGQATDAELETVLRLRDGVERVVEVRSPAGEPVPGASVVVGGRRGLQAGRAGRGGRLRIRAVAGEPVELVVAAPGELRGRFRLTPRAPPEGSGDDASDDGSVVPLSLVAEVPLQGTVVDALSGEPLADAVLWKWEAPGQWTLSRDDGSFVLPEPPGEGVALRAAAAGYLQAELTLRWTAREGPWSVALTPSTRLAGRVVDPTGEPVAGALVEVARMRLTNEPAPPRHRLPGARCDDDGRFEVADLPRGSTFELRVEAPGYAPAWRLVEGDRRRPGDLDLRIVLTPGGTVTGRVVRATGEPAVGARVELTPESRTSRRRWGLIDREEDVSVTVDADGRFTIPDLAQDLYQLRLEEPGGAPLRRAGIEVTAGEMTNLGTLELEAAAVLLGTVVDADGESAVATRVTAVPIPSRTIAQPRAPSVSTRTDDAGRFELAGLRSGLPVELKVESADGLTVYPGQVLPPTDEPLRIVLPRPAEVYGRVVDGAGDGVAGVHVSAVTSRDDDTIHRAPTIRGERSDEDGGFHITGLRAGRLRLQAVEDTRIVEHEVAEPLQPGERRGPVELLMPPGAPLAGRVLHADGGPAVGVRVTAHLRETASPALRSGSVRSVGTVTDSAGGFRIRGLPAGPLRVESDLGRRGRASWQGELEPGGTWIELRAEPQLYVAGRVLDAAGRPLVADLRLEAVEDTVAPLRSTGDVVFEEGFAPPFARSVRSAPDGSFLIGDLPRGRYRLEARAREHVTLVLDDTLAVGPDPVDGLELRLSRGIAVAGRLRGVEASEVGDVQTYAWPLEDTSGRRQEARLSADGRYRIEGLSPGTWRVTARMPATGRAASRTVELPSDVAEVEVDLDLARGLVVEGELRVEGDVPWDALVWLRRLDGEGATDGGEGRGVARVPLGPDGTFRAEGLEPGRYELRLQGGDLGSSPAFIRHLEVASDRSVYVDFAAGRLEGRVVDAAGPRLFHAVVHLQPLDGHLPGQTGEVVRTGEDGVFLFPHVSPGRWRLNVLTRGGRSAAADVVVSAGTTVVEVTVP